VMQSQIDKIDRS